MDSLTFESSVNVVVTAIKRVMGDMLATDAIDERTCLWPRDEGDRQSIDLSSLDLLEVVLDIEEQLGLMFVDDLDPESLVCIGDLASAVMRAQVADPLPTR